MPLLDKEHNTCVSTAITTVEVELMHTTLKKNVNLFACTTFDMSGVSSNIMIDKLSLFKEACLVAQKKRNHGDEKSLAAKEETEKLLATDFIREA